VAESNSVSLGPNDKLIGQLYIEGDLHVNGTVEGQLEATGNVEIGEGGNVKASVAGKGINIGGHVDGAVTASDKLVIGRSGSLNGDIRVARLEIRDGARFSGNVQMGKAAENPAAGQPESVGDTTLVAEHAEGDGEKAKVRKR
jgi:cytoskeletal protein CcmA (bactofilin family)